MAARSLRILGTRGIPAAHGGFETFAERLALYLTERGWQVSVYCQAPPGELGEDDWRGVRRVLVSAGLRGPLGTMQFDWRCVQHAARHRDRCLVLGYNTALFLWPLRRRGIRLFINMDGIEWRRDKWALTAKTWLLANERLGGRLADQIIADHPVIAAYLAGFLEPARITMIPYGADSIQEADPRLVAPWRVTANEYLLLIARLEPENSIAELVRAFSAKRRNCRLLIVGPFDPRGNAYHRRLGEVASPDVAFVGPVYDRSLVDALRYHALLYLHGHRVGGTNPTLVEALGAGCAILAHDNPYNRWVAGGAARYFSTTAGCTAAMDELLARRELLLPMRQAARARHREQFTWPAVLAEYEALLERGD